VRRGEQMTTRAKATAGNGRGRVRAHGVGKSPAPFGRKPYGAAGRRRAAGPVHRKLVVTRRYASLRHRDSPISADDPASTQGAPLAGEAQRAASPRKPALDCPGDGRNLSRARLRRVPAGRLLTGPARESPGPRERLPGCGEERAKPWNCGHPSGWTGQSRGRMSLAYRALADHAARLNLMLRFRRAGPGADQGEPDSPLESDLRGCADGTPAMTVQMLFQVVAREPEVMLRPAVVGTIEVEQRGKTPHPKLRARLRRGLQLKDGPGGAGTRQQLG
jgi:hypothetical protein